MGRKDGRTEGPAGGTGELEWAGWARASSGADACVIPSGARDPAREWLKPCVGKIPRSLRSLGMTPAIRASRATASPRVSSAKGAGVGAWLLRFAQDDTRRSGLLGSPYRPIALSPYHPP